MLPFKSKLENLGESVFAIITENDQSNWDDQTGYRYHFPKKFLKYLNPGTKVIYYKGKIKNKSYSDSRLSPKPHYFGIAEIGDIYPDKASKKNDHFATINNFTEFKSPVLNKKNNVYYEFIPEKQKSNYWRNGVRPITEDVYSAIINDSELNMVFEAASSYKSRNKTDTTEYNQKQNTQTINKTDIERDISDIIENSDLSNSTKLALVNARIGQGEFRKNVIELWGNGEKCALTMIDIRELLIASHIKAWKDCESTNERLDGANGILLCSHLDKLFDRHLLTFVKKGRSYVLKLNPHLDKRQLKSIAIEDGLDLLANNFNTDEQLRFDNYLLHHNQLFEEQSKKY